jgi:hypothetical protein
MNPFGFPVGEGILAEAETQQAVLSGPEGDDLTTVPGQRLRVAPTLNRGRIWWHPATGAVTEFPKV